MDELLTDIQEDKLPTKDSQPVQPAQAIASTSNTNAPRERVISKEECWRMLSGKHLTTGSLLGMWKWAADLGWARYNFDMELTPENIRLLDAYDC